MPDPTSAAHEDALAELRERLRASHAAAERLMDEAQADTGDVPRVGRDATNEVQALATLIGLLREVLPPELREQLTEVVRQLLLLVRAIIDWWVTQLDAAEQERPTPAPVEDIPVD